MAILGQWRMNETSGTSVADSVGGNTGTASSGFTIVSGPLGKARDGSSGSKQITFGSNYNISTWSWSCWSKANSSIPSAQRMISLYPGGTHNDYIRMNSTSSLRCASSSTEASATFSPGSTKWHYYYANMKSGSVDLYADGIKVGTASGTTATGTGTFTISGHSGAGEYWTGSIALVTINSSHIGEAGVKNEYAFIKGFI